MSPAKRAAGYVRVSQVGDRQGDTFHSPQVQREKIQAWAAYRGYEVVAWYTDLDRSAKRGDPRPEFERMMADAAAGRFDAVAVYRLTRFARSVADAARRYSELRDHGVDLVSVTEDIDTSTAGGQLMQNMLFSLAEFESLRIGEEWRAVHARRRRNGIAHVTHPPFGYVVEGARIVGVEPTEAPVVAQLFERRAQGASYTELMDWLEAQGHRPRGGSRRFPRRTIFDMVRNPLYAGLVRDGDEFFDGQHPAIVPRDLWDRVQAMNGRLNRIGRHRTRLLSGLVVCSGCGYRMRLHHSRNRHELRDGPRVYERVDYICGARYHGSPCERRVTISAEGADRAVEEIVLAEMAAERRRMPHGGRVKASRRQREWQEKATRLRGRAAELTRALDSLADQRYVSGSLAEAEYQRQFDRYAGERAKVLDEAEELDRLAATVRPLDLDIIDGWHLLDLEGRQRALRAVVAEVVVHPARSTGRGSRVDDRLEVVWLS